MMGQERGTRRGRSVSLSSRAVIAASCVIAAVIAVGAVWHDRARPVRVETIDLLHELGSAQKRASMPVDQAIHVEFVTIDGDRRQAIFAHPASRLTWPLRLPGRAALKTAIALKPEVWERPNDGVLFRIGIS